jgi:hypothetical protein
VRGDFIKQLIEITRGPKWVKRSKQAVNELISVLLELK